MQNSSRAPKPVRQISSTPKVHRESTLNAIRQKTHDLTARVERLKLEDRRMKDLISKAPGQGQSRLDWLAQQLNTN